MNSGKIGISGTLSSKAMAALAGVALLLLAAPASAQRERTYMFSIAEIRAASEVPGAVSREIRTRLASAIDAHARLLTELPADAPDPRTEPDRFERYMKAKNLRAFNVHMEVTSYRAEVAEQPDPDPGHMITVHIGLRLFGEGIPKRTMDFSGDGSATVQVPAGRRVRDRDRAHAHQTAIRMAVSEAIETSLREIEAKR
jgi:hypothetical protein